MILHFDADAFFASVEQAADPRLRGRPVAVGGQKRGVVASASYEARQLGVRTAMPTAWAQKICPQLVVLPGDFEKYERFSRFLFSYPYDFTPTVEAASIDEGYADLSGNHKISPGQVARVIRRAVRQSLKITLSEGLARNKLVSQIASKIRKPDALIEVPPGGEEKFLAPLESRWLPGVGPRLAEFFRQAGLARIGQVARVSPDQLVLLAGKNARTLWEFAHGIDPRPVITEAPAAKSYSEQETFEQDTTDEIFLLAKLRTMTDRLLRRIRADDKTVRTVEVRIRYNDFEECRRSESLKEPSDQEHDFYPVIRRLLFKAWQRRVSLRLVAIKFSGLYPGIFQGELPLLNAGRDSERGREFSRLFDQIQTRYGNGAAMRGHDLFLKLREQTPRYSKSKTPPADGGTNGLRNGAGGQPKSAGGGKKVPATPDALLNFKSCYSFMASLLRPREIVDLAVERGCRAVAITDPNLHGAVEFYQAAKAAGIQPVIGAELTLAGSSHVAYVENRTGYRNLCALLSMEKIGPEAWEEYGEGLILRPTDHQPEIRYARGEEHRMFRILESIRTLSLSGTRGRGESIDEPFATDASPTHFHCHPDRQAEGSRGMALQQSSGSTTGSLRPYRARRDDRQSRDARYELDRVEEIDDPEDGLRIAERCRFEFDLGKLQIPPYHPPNGRTCHEELRCLTFHGARQKYKNSQLATILPQIEEELSIIAAVGYEDYFLFTWNILQKCREKGIEWITRGSAADSLVCYCLGISEVCPIRFELYFRRFLNPERMALNKLPDIDIDFPHDRKDEVVDLVFQMYGAHAAMVGGFSTFQGRSAFAEIAKTLGVSEFQIRRMTERIPRTPADQVARAVRESLECRDRLFDQEPFRTALNLAAKLDGLPRHPKMHPCGMVLSREPVRHLTPLFLSAKGIPTTHFDMDSVEAVGLVKMDLLAQGGLSVMRDTRQFLAERGARVDLKALEPWKDRKIWHMLSHGGGRGVHHVESPAMLTLQRMVGVDNIDDLIAVVSVIRPGAANSLKKETFARRARGLEPVDTTHPSLASCLRSTYGVVAYEEHILQICEAFAGLDPGRADLLRRGLVKQDQARILQARGEFIDAARKRGRTPEEIARVWKLVAGFQGYAFCRAHSTAYGVEAYQAAFLKCYYPVEFLSAVLTHGKGFYNRLVYSIECRRLGIDFLAPDINASTDRYQPEATRSIRVPLWQIKGVSEATLARWKKEKPFRSLTDFYQRVRPATDEMTALIRAGAFDGFGVSRSRQFWRYRQLAQWTRGGVMELLPTADETDVPEAALQEPTRLERLRSEQELLGFTVSGHPLEMYPRTRWSSYCPIARLERHVNRLVRVAGLIIEDRLHHQVDGRLMKFISICDPTGILECELFADTYGRFGLETVRHPVVEVSGKVEPSGNGVILRVIRAAKARECGAGQKESAPR